MAEKALATQDAGTSDPLKAVMRSPATRQLLLLVAVAAAVALGVAVVLWSRGPNYGLLYTGLNEKDASAITQALQASNTPFKLGADGGSIMVPAADLPAIRLRLAGQGLPQGTAASGALPAADSPFGMSDLAERTRYQQMLESDLGNTIATLQSVRSARVHLALAKPSAFIRDSRQASASVLVTLFPGRQLDSSQVAAIVHLVAASVPDLDPRQVSVIDQQGQLLTGDPAPDDPGALGDTRLRLATRIENTYAERIEQLLTPLVGPGKVHAQVYADLDFSRSERATETYDPDHPALRSEQTSSEQHSGGGAAGGIPGALSNQPPATVQQPTAAKPNAGAGAGPGASTTAQTTATDSSSSATRNYELDHTISHVTDPAGRLARLTVAVVVDNKSIVADDGSVKSVPFTPQEIGHLEDLAKNAVGFDAKRGDSVSVVNQAFHQAPAPEAPQEVPMWQRPGVLDLVKQGLGILIALVVAFGLLRPLLKGLLRGPQPALAVAGGARMPAVSVRIPDEEEDEAPKLQGPQQAIAYEAKINMARRMVNENPKQVAQVVKNWVSDDGG